MRWGVRHGLQWRMGIHHMPPAHCCPCAPPRRTHGPVLIIKEHKDLATGVTREVRHDVNRDGLPVARQRGEERLVADPQGRGRARPRRVRALEGCCRRGPQVHKRARRAWVACGAAHAVHAARRSTPGAVRRAPWARRIAGAMPPVGFKESRGVPPRLQVQRRARRDSQPARHCKHGARLVNTHRTGIAEVCKPAERPVHKVIRPRVHPVPPILPTARPDVRRRTHASCRCNVVRTAAPTAHAGRRKVV